MLSQATSALAGRIAATLAEHDLTLDQWRVLHTLTETGPQTMSELVRETHITGPTMSRVVDKMVERALLYRNVDTDDRRRVVVHAADRGIALDHELAPRIREAEHSGLVSLSSREARTLRRLLERISHDQFD